MSRKEEAGLGVRRWELGRWGIGIFLCWPNGYGDSLGIVSSLGESKSKFEMYGNGRDGDQWISTLLHSPWNPL